MTIATGDSGVVRNVYDVTGQRVLRVELDGSKTIYLGSSELRWTPGDPTIDVARHYPGGTHRQFDGSLTYTVSGHQGSVIASVDATTGTATYNRYLPYGELRSGATVDDQGFLGQTHDDTTNLVYLNNRYHDPTLGSFLSVDPLVTMTGEPYIYASADPVNGSDPSGLCTVISGEVWCTNVTGYWFNHSDPNYGPAREAARADAAGSIDVTMEASFLPVFGEAIDAGTIASGVINRDIGDVASGSAGIGLPFVGAPFLKKFGGFFGDLLSSADEVAPIVSPGRYVPDRTLPTDRWGVPVPDADVPHTQLGRSKSKYGAEPQAREWDVGDNGNLQPRRDIDFTDHGSPANHPKPHQHQLTPNNPKLAPKGGYQRGNHQPF